MGIIYICESINTPGILKVGIADNEINLKQRFSAHRTDGYKGQQFEPFFAVSTSKYQIIEQLIKTLFSKSRILGTELYVLEKEDLKRFFEIFADKTIFPQPQVVLENATAAIKKKQIASKIKRSMLGIQYGDHLVFALNDKYNKNYIVENIDDDVVRYEGNDYSISKIALTFLQECGYKTQNVSGNDYFIFKGKTLTTIAREKGLIK